MANIEFQSLPTARQDNERHLFLMWHDWVYDKSDGHGYYIECVVPDQQTAREFLEASEPLKCDTDGWPIHRHKFSEEKIKECEEKVALFKEMHLDMRDQVMTAKDGKVGLQDVAGKIIVPAIFDCIPERYTPDDRDLIPVVKDGVYYLYDCQDNKLLTPGYDCIFRYFGGYVSYYVAQQDGKLGILESLEGAVLVPIEMDEIFGMQDPDGCIPFTKDGKWGVAQLNVYAPPIFDHLEVWSEEYVKVWLNGEQGWVDSHGRFTIDFKEACIGSWYDSYK